MSNLSNITPARRRPVFTQPVAIYGTGCVLASQGAGASGVYLSDPNVNGAYHMLFIPADFVTLQRAVALLWPEAGSAGNIYLNCSTNFGKNGEAYNTHTGTLGYAAHAIVASQYFEYNISAALTGLAALDFLHVNIYRDASNALDTCNGAGVICGGILLEYL